MDFHVIALVNPKTDDACPTEFRHTGQAMNRETFPRMCGTPSSTRSTRHAPRGEAGSRRGAWPGLWAVRRLSPVLLGFDVLASGLELAQDLGDVVLDGPGGQEQDVGYLLVGGSFGEQFGDLPFAG